MKRRRLIIVVMSVVAAAAAIWIVGSYIYDRMLRPNEIQYSLIGKNIVEYRELQQFSDDRGPFGEGLLRWRYLIKDGGMVDAETCHRFAKSECDFVLSRKLQEGITVYLEVRDGREVIVGEIWD